MDDNKDEFGLDHFIGIEWTNRPSDLIPKLVWDGFMTYARRFEEMTYVGDGSWCGIDSVGRFLTYEMESGEYTLHGERILRANELFWRNWQDRLKEVEIGGYRN